jgi:alpha/beta superfamily hydrolase
MFARNASLFHVTFKAMTLLVCLAECIAALSTILDAGNGRGSDGELVSIFQNRIDDTRICVGGHSFGAATAISVAMSRPVQACIALDAWMFPLLSSPTQKSLTLSPLQSATSPILFIQGETYLKWKENFCAMHSLYLSLAPGSRLVTLKRTGHHNFTDFAWYVHFM